MTGLGRSVTRFARKATPKELPKDPGTDKAGDAALKTRFGPKIPQPEQGPVIPLPDEEALGRARRRQRSRRRGGRAATALTMGGDEETVG